MEDVIRTKENWFRKTMTQEGLNKWSLIDLNSHYNKDREKCETIRVFQS